MRTTRRLDFPGNHAATGLRRVAVLVATAILIALAPARADIPDPPPARFRGIYKVTSSTDPLFPATPTCEYFLDFGRGIQPDRLGGSVAVSERRNPKVRVRIMAWQYFPERGMIVMGNPFAEGARNALAKGAWQIAGTSNGFVLKREACQIVLQPAGPGDY